MVKRIVINRSLDSLKKKKLELFPLDDELYKLSEEENEDQNTEYYEGELNRLKKE